MKEKKLEHKWGKIVNDVVQKAQKNGLNIAEALEKSEKHFFQYFFEYLPITKNHSNVSVIDVGCGTGLISKELAERGFNAHGVDFSSEVIKIAKRLTPKVDFRCSSIYKLPFKDETFDIVVCLGVFQTVAEPEKALREMKRVLRKNGIIIIRTLNSLSLLAIISLKKINEPFLTFYNPLRFRRLMKKEGFTNVSLKGIYFLPDQLQFFTNLILCIKIYRFFNLLFFPIFMFFAHSFCVDGIKK